MHGVRPPIKNARDMASKQKCKGYDLLPSLEQSQSSSWLLLSLMVHAGCICVAIIHWTLTWTTRSLSCAQMIMHTIAHGGVQHRKRVCTESWLWEKNPLPHQGIKSAPAEWQSDVPTNWTTSHPPSPLNKSAWDTSSQQSCMGYRPKTKLHGIWLPNKNARDMTLKQICMGYRLTKMLHRIQPPPPNFHGIWPSCVGYGFPTKTRDMT